ncbi:oligosaccharide flippase family protein [Clostridium sp.]|uniref:oligosaccharide flippase family protein n=1 Tax=Clostridium sp. TaxID=1506 RepID=UPI00346432CB
MSFKRNLISNVIFQIINIIIAFCTSVIAARALGPELRGQSAYFMLIITTICEFVDLGINNSVIYFLKKSRYDSSEVLGTNLIFLIANSVFIGALLLFLRILGVALSNYSIFVCIVGATSVIFASLKGMGSELYIAREEVYKLNKSLLAFKLIKILVFAILYIGGRFNIMSYLITMNFITIIEGATIFLSIKNSYEFSLKINFQFFRVEIKYAIKMILAHLFIYLNYKMDQVLIKVMLDDYQLGLYSVAVYLAEILFLVPTCINSALIGKVSNMKTDFKDVIIKTIKVTFNLSIILSLVGCLCTALVPMVYGSEYAAIKITIVILFAGIIFASIGKVAYTYFTMNNKPEVHMYISVMTLIINIIGNFVLIPLLGINGAAIASTISYTLFGVIYLVILNRKEYVKYADMLFITSKDFKDMKATLKKIVSE